MGENGGLGIVVDYNFRFVENLPSMFNRSIRQLQLLFPKHKLGMVVAAGLDYLTPNRMSTSQKVAHKLGLLH